MNSEQYLSLEVQPGDLLPGPGGCIEEALACLPNYRFCVEVARGCRNIAGCFICESQVSKCDMRWCLSYHVQKPHFMNEVDSALILKKKKKKKLVGEIYSFLCNEILCIPYGLHEFI